MSVSLAQGEKAPNDLLRDLRELPCDDRRKIADAIAKSTLPISPGGDEYLESDAVFGVKTTLIAPYEKVDNGETLWRSPFDFVLVPR